MSKSWEQILGGYATNTLTEEEKRQLFEAALHDQTLFDALADEEALKALLADPNARERILASLQTSEIPQETARPHRSQLSWFRRPSSLAWTGSIAAAGLALIFGWQMNKDWGPLVEQEQQVERAMSQVKDNDRNLEVFRSQESETAEIKEQTQVPTKKDQREPERVAGLSAPVSPPQRLAMAKASKDSEPMLQASRQVRSEGNSRQKVKKERRLKAEQSMSQPPESAIVQIFPDEEPIVAPSAASPETPEDDFQPLFRSPHLADQGQKGDVLSSRSARDLYYANKLRGADAVEEELDGMRTQQLLGGLSSQAKKALTDEVSDLKESPEAVQDNSQAQTRGIRYSFVRRAADGKDEAIDPTNFPGKWSDLQLEIEANVSGHLYVLTLYGTGKWQWMRPESLNAPRASDGAIQVQAYQRVNFAISQVTNRLGKPVVSSITVLLSSTPLTDLGKWLGRGLGPETSEGPLFEHAELKKFVIDSSREPGIPLEVNIALGEQ